MSVTEEESYNVALIDQIFQERPHLKIEIDKIVDSLRGIDPSTDKESLLLLSKSGIKELIDQMLQAFAEPESKILSIDELTAEQQSIFFQEINNLSKELSTQGPFKGETKLLTLVVDQLSESYIKTLEHDNEAHGEFLTLEDRKRIKEEMARMARYEVYKIVNTNRVAGETKEENELHNLVYHGIKPDADTNLTKSDIKRANKAQTIFNENYTVESDFRGTSVDKKNQGRS